MQYSSRRADPALRTPRALSADERALDVERLDAATAGLDEAVRALAGICRDDDVFRAAVLGLVEAEVRRFRRLAAVGTSLRSRPSNRWSGEFFKAITESAERIARNDGADRYAPSALAEPHAEH